MQETLIHFAEQHLYLHIVLIIFCTAAILIAMALDLFFGIRKAHERGQPTTSVSYTHLTLPTNREV